MPAQGAEGKRPAEMISRASLSLRKQAEDPPFRPISSGTLPPTSRPAKGTCMKPAPFDYIAPNTQEEALSLLGEHGFDAKILAGGQSLIPMLNFRLAQPALLVDCHRIPGLDFVHRGDDGSLRLGAMTAVRELERRPVVAQICPLLREAVPFIAHPQIRNRGTIGGSIAHADPAGELPALMVAAEARFRLLRGDTERWVDAADFFVGLLTTVLEHDELLTEVAVPEAPPGTGWAFEEVSRRLGDFAQVGAAARITLDADGRCRSARLVFLSVGDVPYRASEAVAGLLGEIPSLERIREAAELAKKAVDPFGDIHASAAFKRHLAGVVARRTLLRAARKAGEAR